MNDPAAPGPLGDAPGRRTVVDTLRLLRSRTTEGFEGAARLLRGDRDPDLPERDRRRLATLIDAGLDPRLGPVVARARAGEVADAYVDLGATSAGAASSSCWPRSTAPAVAPSRTRSPPTGTASTRPTWRADPKPDVAPLRLRHCATRSYRVGSGSSGCSSGSIAA